MSISKETYEFIINKANNVYNTNYIDNSDEYLKDLEHKLNFYENYTEFPERLTEIQKAFNDYTKNSKEFWNGSKNKILEKNRNYSEMLNEIDSIDFPEEYADLIDVVKRDITRCIEDLSHTNSELERLNKLTFEDWIKDNIECTKHSIKNFKEEIKEKLRLEAKKANLKVFLNDQEI